MRACVKDDFIVLGQTGIDQRVAQALQKTPHGDRLISEVTITDPTHPLFGRTFALINPKIPARQKTLLTIRLPNGQPRAVPRSATNLALDTADENLPATSVLPISVHTMLPLAHHIHRLVQVREERTNETPCPTITTSTVSNGQSLSETIPSREQFTPTLEQARSRPSATTGPRTRAINSASPSHPKPHSQRGGRS